MESTLFTELSISEESNLSGGRGRGRRNFGGNGGNGGNGGRGGDILIGDDNVFAAGGDNVFVAGNGGNGGAGGRGGDIDD